MKDPESWSFIVSPEMRAALMTIVTAWLRRAYDDKATKWQRISIETMLCGAVSFGVGSGLSYFENLPPGVAVFAGMMIGLFGIDFVRKQGKRYISGHVKGGRDE